MKKAAKFLCGLILSGFMILLCNQCASRKDRDNVVYLENGKLRLGFERSAGKLVYLRSCRKSIIF